MHVQVGVASATLEIDGTTILPSICKFRMRFTKNIFCALLKETAVVSNLTLQKKV